MEASIRIMNIIYSASGVFSVLFTLLLLAKKQRSRADYILALWFLLILMAISTIYINHNSLPAPQWLFDLTDGSVYLHGPIIWFYARALTDNQFRFKKRDALHLLPFLLGTSYLLYYSLGGRAAPEPGREVVLITKMALLPVYGIAVLMHLAQHKRNVTNYYSFTEKIMLRWLQFLVWGFLIIWAIAVISQFVYAYGEQDIPQYGGLFTNLALCLFVLIIGYFGIRQTTIFVPAHLLEGARETPEPQTGKAGIPNDKKSEMETSADEMEWPDKKKYYQLVHLMETEKPYLDGELTLFKLAIQVQLPPHQISKLINNYGGVNFFDFVNQYRVEEVKKKIRQQAHVEQTLLALALDCGFNSKASFNRAFKKWAGQTPREYIKESRNFG